MIITKPHFTCFSMKQHGMLPLKRGMFMNLRFEIIMLMLANTIPSRCNDQITSPVTSPRKAIVIGASAGMGREVAKHLAADGYIVGLAARRTKLLHQIQLDIPSLTYVQQIDIAKPDEAVQKLADLIQLMGGMDLLVIASSGFRDVDFGDRQWTANRAILDTDVIGFYALARTGVNFFEKQGYGHLVGFSSIDGLRGIAQVPSYSAAKSFCSRYLEAERNYFKQKDLPIIVTELLPGWINSANDPDFKQHNPKAYWVDSLQDATRDIMQAIKDQVSVAYITKRWQQVADVLKVMPDDLYNALGGL